MLCWLRNKLFSLSHYLIDSLFHPCICISSFFSFIVEDKSNVFFSIVKKKIFYISKKVIVNC